MRVDDAQNNILSGAVLWEAGGRPPVKSLLPLSPQRGVKCCVVRTVHVIVTIYQRASLYIVKFKLRLDN